MWARGGWIQRFAPDLVALVVIFLTVHWQSAFVTGSDVVPVKSISMPKLSSTMTEGVVSAWKVAVGDKVNPGTILVTIESDKAEMDVESFEEGFVAKILVPDGDTALVDEPLALLVTDPAHIAEVNGLRAGHGTKTGDDDDVRRREVNSAAATDNGMNRSSSGHSVDGVGTTANFDATIYNTNNYLPTSTTTTNDSSSRMYLPGTAAVASGAVGAVSNLIKRHVPAGVDQAVEDNLHPDVTPSDVGKQLFDAVSRSPDLQSQLDSLQAAPGGKAFVDSMKERAALRMPPPHILHTAAGASTTDTAAGSAQQQQKSLLSSISQKASEVAMDHGLFLQDTPSSGRGYHAAPDNVGGIGIDTNIINSTPKARLLAQQKNIRVSEVNGSGPGGRVTPKDVDSFGAKPPQRGNVLSPPTTTPGVPLGSLESSRIPLSNMQKTIARNMMQTTDIPVFRVTKSIAVDQLQAVYRAAKSQGVTWSAVIAKAVAVVLSEPKHNLMNSNFADNMIIHRNSVNIAMAVASPNGGLLTPVINNADSKGIVALAQEWSSLVTKVSSKTITPAECTGGTFFISNLGQFDVDQFDAILPKGVGSILSIGRAVPRVVPDMSSEGAVTVRNEMTVTLTCDHRHINGVHAGAFLQDLAQLIESNPTVILR